MKQFKNRRFMKMLSFILCMALVLSGISWNGLTAAGAADTGSTAVYYGNGYSVTIGILYKWNSGYNANVTIKNTSESEIRNWELVMTGADSVSSVWNAKKLSQEDGTLKIGNDGWNQDIAPRSSVSFGFQSLSGSASMPVECHLAGDRQDASDEDYRIVFRAINTWEGGCVVETDILNLTDKDIEDWDVSFTWENIKIADIWNAVIKAENDGSYTITNDTYNSTVPANGKVTFGMRLETGTGGLIFPSDAKLSRWTGDADVSNGGNKTDDKTDDKTGDKTEEPSYEELRKWNRTMMNMDSDIVQEAVNHVDKPIKVAILDSGVDAMTEIPVVERFNLIDGEDEMTEMFEDATGHGTAVASVMAYHREKEEEAGEGTGTEEGKGNTYTYDGFTYEYFTDDIEDLDEYFELGETEEEDSETENDEDITEGADENDSEWDDYEENEADEDYGEDEEDGEDLEGTIRLGEFVEEHQADFEGINPNMELYSVRLLDEMNEASVSDVIKGIRWAMENDIKIINISFGTETDSPELHKVIKEAEKKGILIIAAAGNNGEVQYPAAYDEVIAVGSVDYTGKVESECENDTYVELTAPGEGVLAVGPFGVETEAGGTSIAAGEVSAVASILWQHDPTVSNRFIRQLLRAGANKSDNTAMGYGIVDCEYSLSIFEDLKATFVDNEDAATEELMEEAGIEENSDELGTEGIVTANWGGKNHLKLVSDSEIKVTGDYLKVLKIGARLQDAAFCNLNDKKIFPALHGNFEDDEDISPKTKKNYVAGYLYLSRLSKWIFDKHDVNENGYYSINIKCDYWNKSFNKLGMETIISEGGINTGGEILNRNINKYNKKKLPESDWGNILKSNLYDESVKAGKVVLSDRGFEDIPTNRALVVYGMSLHTLTDTFAHSSWGYGNRKSLDPRTWKWGKLSQVTYNKEDNGLSYNDDPDVRHQRYVAAKQAVLNSMDNIEVSDDSKTIENINVSKTLDFSSRKYYLEKMGRGDDNTCKHDIIDINNYFYPNKNHPIGIKKKYFEKGFGILKLCPYVNKCEENEKNEENKSKDAYKYCQRIDYDNIKKITNKYGIVSKGVSVTKGKKNTEVKAEVFLNRKGKESVRILNATGEKDGTLCFALNKRLKSDSSYTVKITIDGKPTVTTIDSNTPFKEREETDEETDILMDTWDIDVIGSDNPNEEQLRIVLTWDNGAMDLDSHIEGISEYFHVYHGNKKYLNSKGELTAELDVDDSYYYGPETITVYNPNTSFEYFVRNFSGGGRTVLSNSNATVRVYKGDKLMKTYHAPFGNGVIWNVFSYDGNTGTITPTGTMY